MRQCNEGGWPPYPDYRMSRSFLPIRVCIVWAGLPYQPTHFSAASTTLKLIQSHDMFGPTPCKPNWDRSLPVPNQHECYRYSRTKVINPPTENIDFLATPVWNPMTAVAFRYLSIRCGVYPNGIACPHPPTKYEIRTYSRWFDSQLPAIHWLYCSLIIRLEREYSFSIVTIHKRFFCLPFPISLSASYKMLSMLSST